MVMDGDLWGPAVKALERYQKGEWDTPGEALADQLCKETFGGDSQKALAWLVKSLKSLKPIHGGKS
jgi:hypothetical protein